MGSWISKDGKMYPMKERAVFTDGDGNPQIYEGPDRSAVEYLKETGQEYLGMHFSEDPDIINRAHERKMSIKQLTKTDINTDEKRKKEFEEKEKMVVNHQPPKVRAKQVKPRSGGQNFAGSEGHKSGGLGDPSASDVVGKQL